MILIDIDVKIEKIDVTPLAKGMNASFELRDKNNLDTVLVLKFYKKQVDFIMQKFYEVDRKKLKGELRLEFLKREEIVTKGLREELDELRLEHAILVDQIEVERKEEDAKATD